MAYISQNVNLSDSQKSKIQAAYKKNKGTSIKLSNTDLMGTDTVQLTRSQVSSLNKARRLNKGVRFTLSKTQISQSGGFLQYLPLVMPALTALAKAGALGAAGSLAGSLLNKAVNKITGRNFKKSSQNEISEGRRNVSSRHALTNIDINRRMKSMNSYIGTFPKNNLPPKCKATISAIVNLDNMGGNGTHWVAIKNDPKFQYAEYFDSFGLAPPMEIEKFLLTSGKPILFNTEQVQLTNLSNCGHLCIDYLKRRLKNESPYEAIRLLKNN